MSKRDRLDQAEIILPILDRGEYNTPKGRHDITTYMQTAHSKIKIYSPNLLKELETKDFPQDYNTEIEITSETTLEAIFRVAPGFSSNVIALNFASAKTPGGGFISGAKAQEESLCRGSGLYSLLNSESARPYYIANRKDPKKNLYQNYIIYTPDVPVIATDTGDLVSPFLCSFITSAAPNAKKAKEDKVEDSVINEVLSRRIEYILKVCAEEKYKTIILGAWGCGVFGNDTEIVARIFRFHLGNKFGLRGVFEKVIFAIPDDKKRETFEMFF